MSIMHPHHRTRYTRNRGSVRLALAAMLLALVALAACGGDDDGEPAAEDPTITAPTTSETTAAPETSETTTAPTTSETTTAPTTSETTTTAAPRAEADSATADLANAAILRAEDFPEGWNQYAEAEPWTPSEESCAAVNGGGPEDTLLDGAALNGPIMQFGDAPLFVSSRAYVFPTEADAIAWVDITKGDAWGECQRARIQEAYYPDGGAEMRVVTRDNEVLGEAGFESYLELDGTNADGEYTALVVFSIHRLGRTVIRAGIEDAGSGADSDTLTFAQHDALTAAYDRVYALG